MSTSVGGFVSRLSTFFTADIEPYLFVMVALGVLLWIGVRLTGNAKLASAKRAVAGEVRLNLEVCKAVIEYVEAQKTGTPYGLPMPRFYTEAYSNMRTEGYLFRLKKDLRRDIVAVYMTIDRVHAASTRQEDLAVGPAAASPLASDLRSQNLAFILGNVTNIIQPQLQRLDEYYGRR